MGFAVRIARTLDGAAIAPLEAAAFAQPWSPRAIAGTLGQDSTRAWVASSIAPESASGLLGWVALRLLAGEAELLRIATRPEARRRGIARALLRAGLRDLEREGINVCHLEVASNNDAAICFYNELGFVPTGCRRRYYPDHTDALLLTRTRCQTPTGATHLDSHSERGYPGAGQ